MRIGEEVFAVFAPGWQGNTDCGKNGGANVGGDGRTRNIMCALTECAIRVAGTVRMDVHKPGRCAKRLLRRTAATVSAGAAFYTDSRAPRRA